MLPASPNDRRHTSGANPAMPWIVLGLLGFVVLAAVAVWVAAQAGAASGHPVPSADRLPGVLAHRGLRAVLGENRSPTLFYLALGGQAAVVVAAGITATVLIARRRPRDGRTALVTATGFTDLQRPAMAERAKGLRPSLADTRARDLTARQVGAALGEIGGRTVFKSHEDVELVICGPRSNKTSAKVVPEILAAPGMVVATSNKGDVWTLTADLRAKVGPVYLFDPNRITYMPQQFWWNPLSVVTDVESAARLASYFMREVGDDPGGGNRADPFFTPAAAKTLRQILLGAACARPARNLRDVALWVATRSEEPAVHLDHAGYHTQAAALRATLELAPETRGGIYEGVATAISCLDSEPLLRWATPPSTWENWASDPDGVRELDLWSLITQPGAEHPTLYLLTREGQGTGRPLVAAIVGELFHIASQAAAARGGRLDPPITVQLDEAANIVRLPELPAWYSWFGSQGLMVTTVLQSREQGRSVWGKEGFDALWSAATIKTVGAGIADPDFAEDLSRLVGDHKIEETSTSYSSGTGHSLSRSLRTERIYTAADIAALPRTNALLFTSGRRPGLLTLKPWYAEPNDERAEISDYAERATRQVQRAALDFLGPNNPLAAALREQSRGEAG
jgi:type IV secretion system protein VirD4